MMIKPGLNPGSGLLQYFQPRFTLVEHSGPLMKKNSVFLDLNSPFHHAHNEGAKIEGPHTSTLVVE